MAEPDAGGRGGGDRVAAAAVVPRREAVVDGAGEAVRAAGGVEACATAPEGGGRFDDGKKAFGAEERQLGDSAESISVRLEGGDHMGEGKKVCSEERLGSTEEEKRGLFHVELRDSPESGNLATCHVVNGGVWNYRLRASSGEAFGSKDVACIMHDALSKTKEGSQCELGVLVCDGGGVVNVKIRGDDLMMGGNEACGDIVGVSDLRKVDSEGSPPGADSKGSNANANCALEKEVLLPKIDEEVARLLDKASLPSISDSCFDASLDGNAGQIGDISEKSVGIEKSARDLNGGDMHFCVSGSREDRYVEENQRPSMDALHGINLFESKAASMENFEACANGSAEIGLSLQQADQKDGSSKIPPERNLTNSSHVQSCEDSSCCSAKESSAEHHTHKHFAGVESAPLGQVEEFDVCNSADAKTCAGNFAENVNNGEPLDAKPTQLIVFRRRNPKRAASSRNTQNLEKPEQANKARNSTGKSKKVVSASSLLLSTMVKFPNKAMKRRSGMNRPLQHSAWGSLQNLINSFDQKLLTSVSDLTSLGSERSKRCSDEKQQPCIRKGRSSRFSKNKFAVPSDIGRAKDASNGQSTFPVMVDTHASSEGHKEHIPKLACDASSIDVCDEVGKTSRSNEGKYIVKLKLVQTDKQQLERDLESTVTQETHTEYINGEFTRILTSEPSVKNGKGTVMLDPGSSPDSVVYNPVSEVTAATCEGNTSASCDVVVHENILVPGALAEDGVHAVVLATSNLPKNHALDSPVNLEQLAKTVGESKSTKKAEIGPSCVMLENQLDEGKMQASEKANVVTKPKSLRKQICKKKDGIKEKNRKTRSSTKVSSRKASKLRAFSNDSSLLDSSKLAVRQGSPNFDSCFEAPASSEQDLGTRLHEHETSVAPRHKKKYGHGRMKGKAGNPHVKGKNKKRGLPGDALLDHSCFSLPSQSATELAASGLNELSELSPATELALKNSTMSTKLPHKAACRLDGASVLLPPRAAWVCCDDCQKWRCIPSELADIIGETHCRWTCKDNEDKAFADCSIPQEKTNAEINAELELSDASADEANNAGSNSRACRPPSWTPIRSNLFLHRNRRTQSIDESMVCNCKLPEDGRMGCGDRCLNRILNIECVKRTCPCGDLCSNQQFQRRNYAKLRWSHSGKKGYGLQLKKNVSEGQFLIEYVGEVLDITAYESRQTHYASKGQKHFYFMALNGGEVIDACSKGNLGRFINHSCSPNCRTEKWMVNGEVCIGIFAIRNIKKGEELTFDYNYVRVSGAAPQKCFCGTAKCRGYIGGDTFVDTTAQGDAEVGYFECVTVDRDAVKQPVANEFGPDVAEHEETSMQREDSNDCSSAIPDLEPCQQTGGTLSDISEPDNCLQALSPHEAEDIIRTPIHVSQPMESSVRHFPIPSTWSEEYHQKASCLLNGSRSINDMESNLVSDFNVTKENKLKHLSNPRQSCPIGNAKDSTASRETLVFHKEKKMPTDTGDGHLLGVEGRLNNLLDADGGISKRKDATNGYLKLLLVTAAEGDDAGGASKSVRDLSLILDALLKTKSHAVLLDIINKNGLQMLHNILKQNRSNFHRTPIIRKLLKVLEFLALKEILTPEHINGGPRCAGVESFKDSMLSLTRHNNSQVHQIARNFCDKWISCAIPRSGPMEREDSHLHSQRNFSNKLHAPLTNCQCGQRNRVSDAIVCVDTTAHLPASSSAWDIQGVSTASGPASIATSSSDCKSTGRRKRKSRWDQPSDDHYEMVGLKVQKVCSKHGESGPQIGCVYNGVPCMSGSTAENVDDEVPPGFGSQQEHHPAQISCGGIAPGFCQERYQPHLSISYGIPVALVRHFGTPETEGQHHNRWKIAPGVPFCPFPPLPPYPRGDPCPSTSSQMSWHCDDTLAMKHSTSGQYQRSVNRDERIHRNWRNGGGMRWPSSYHARKFPRQWSNHCRIERHRPPWPREQDGLRSRGRELASSGFGNSSSNIHGNSCSPKM